ncbi:hypothetical protein [Paenibacillus planticolens]|uniref:Uncharacterized protein n=1 Tax=Paenibacillus planticolens TaxID=2654976 RepID=A0ABX1ZI31_9BACL|nr:hypothetical protein [Paenibacillus planticolens]NOU98413.1 hypothetical protein [Paenibacillus planticolens]
MIVRKPIAFNVDDAHQRELLEWVASRSNNFSGFVKDVLFAFKSGVGAAQVTAEAAVEASPVRVKYANVGDIF